ncbi:hypothetical protein FA95DRAFT_126721 [Auriscalpium vulgare]|uniref:Uncharacterized protein n=1 Tax=Auriscalpium vulgare TaxID=40419 RepID=A0ACB8RMG3_9AGAM|nr:hypothetical protein FA95DRAFT_126721 [Auriscalpium vulgare]
MVHFAPLLVASLAAIAASASPLPRHMTDSVDVRALTSSPEARDTNAHSNWRRVDARHGHSGVDGPSSEDPGTSIGPPGGTDSPTQGGGDPEISRRMANSVVRDTNAHLSWRRVDARQGQTGVDGPSSGNPGTSVGPPGGTDSPIDGGDPGTPNPGGGEPTDPGTADPGGGDPGTPNPGGGELPDAKTKSKSKSAGSPHHKAHSGGHHARQSELESIRV